MKRTRIFPIVMVFAFLGGTSHPGNAQTPTGRQGERPNETTQRAANPGGEDAQPKEDAAGIRAGTKIKAELESTLDARTAKPGDEVTARVTQDVKQKGQTVVRKGDHLVGRVTEVEAEAQGEGGSRMAVTFDRLVRGEETSQLNAVVNSVLSVPGENPSAGDRMMESEPVLAPMPVSGGGPAPSGGGGGGGLLGGVGSTVGSTVGATGAVVGRVAGGVGSTVNSSTSASGSVLRGTTGALDATSQNGLSGAAQAGLATPRRAIRLDSQGQAENETAASSLLSTRKGDLRMDSGTKLEFRTEAEAQAKE